MSDSVYSPLSEHDEDTEPASTEVKVESWGQFKRDFEKAAGVDHDELTVEDATTERVLRRQAIPTPENASERPIVRLKSTGGPQSVREASEDLSFSRGLAQREEMLAAGHTEEEVQRAGIEKMDQALRGDPLEPPPNKVSLTDKFGEPEAGELSADEAAAKIGIWRQEQAKLRAAELAEISGELEQRQQQEYEAQQQPSGPQPEQPKPQQDAIQRERTQLAAERQSLALLRQMDSQEAQLHSSYQNLVNQVLTDFPSLRQAAPTPADMEELRQQAPARFQALVAADAALKQHQLQLATFAQQRGQRTQAAAQQRAAARAQQDHAFEEKAARLIPNWEHVEKEVKQQAHKTLQDAGMSKEEIVHLWSGDHTIDAHSSVLQLVLAKAALWDSAHAKAQTIRQSGLPSVIRPGVGNSFARGNSDRVADIKARLRTAKGNAGLKLGAELVRAQRNRD